MLELAKNVSLALVCVLGVCVLTMLVILALHATFRKTLELFNMASEFVQYIADKNKQQSNT